MSNEKNGEKLSREDMDLLKAMAERLKDNDQDFTRHERSAFMEQAAQSGLNTFLVSRILDNFSEYYRHRDTQDALAASNPQFDRTRGITVAFQGSEGAYSHLAINKYFADKKDLLQAVGYPTFREAFDAVKNGEVDFAMLPIENTIAGSINQTYDLLSHTNLSILGEEIWPVKHCLLAVEEIPLSRVRRIYSHPVALEQCTVFFSELTNCAIESFTDTAEAAKRVKNEQDLSHAAVASEEAAELYGLTIIKRDIANSRENFTRFVLIGRDPLKVEGDIPCTTSLLLVTSHEKGALVECLKRLSEHNLNMTKLESRPITGAPWEYMFYIDIEGNVDSPEVKKGLDAVRQKAKRLRVLGCYPSLRAAEAAKKENAEMPKPSVTAVIEKAEKKAPATVSCQVDLPFKLASKQSHPEKSVYKIKDVMIGEGFTIMAGPCAVESREQIMESARIVKENGGHILRGGVFKPRTSPYSFQGLGAIGLEYMAEAGERYGLPIITEVVSLDEVELVAAKSDILQIGARNMQNFPLLKEVGMCGKPVFIKRGMMSSIEEWMLAAEYVLHQGNQQVMLCERGIRSFDTATRNTLDISAVPVGQSMTHLPIFIDPSHACGVREWVSPLAAAAAAVHSDGIMVEIHPNPDEAMCDKNQALSERDFVELLENVRKVNESLAV